MGRPVYVPAMPIADRFGPEVRDPKLRVRRDAQAEALRLSWCDLQLAFLPRNPGEPYGPPVRLLSRLGASDFEARVQRGELTAS